MNHTVDQPLAARAARSGTARVGRRPDYALCVAVVGVAAGLALLIPLVRATAPGPPSPAPATAAQPTDSPVAGSSYRMGASVVSRGIAYSALSVERATSLALPGAAGDLRGNLVIVKLRVRDIAATPSTASIGLVDLERGGVDYRPLLAVATALAHTGWQALVLRTLAPGSSARVKLFFELPTPARASLGLLVGSHARGAPRFAVPLGGAA